ncbi:DUF1269 domain-containing protein [Bacillus xiapuensis]|uniref:DUF1269 domain-containing protein n=1 Tax=Bacillus xiapuensis TaxID=2014075 RepID=UPI000C238D76|nr:DUF1269 domain-containing protein [Bacillus xiapuensis]
MEKQVLIMTFPKNSQAYEAFSRMKALHLKQKVVVEQMAVVHHEEDQSFQVKDVLDMTGEDQLVTGGVIGMLVGMLGGPLGVLLGWATGSIIGGTGDAMEMREAVTAFEQTSKAISPGKTGLIVIASEYVEEEMDRWIGQELNGKVLTLPEHSVRRDIEAARKAERELRKEARKKWFNETFRGKAD